MKTGGTVQAERRAYPRVRGDDSFDILAHELKTPLTGLLASSQLMLEEVRNGGPDALRALADNIHLTARTLNDRILELLDFIATGMVEIGCRAEIVDLRSVVREATAEAWVFLLRRRQKLVVELPQRLPPVWGDPRRLRQVMVNLLSNASKFSPEGGTIAVRGMADESEVRIEVSDSAPAISSEERDLVFAPYYRGRHKSAASGSGLGLAICKKFLKRQKGKIWAEEGRGGGNTFCVSLPR